MFDLNWNDVICSKFEDGNFPIINPLFLQSKHRITDKQKDYIKNLFYRYYIPCSERQFEYFDNKLNELNKRNASEIINALLNKNKYLISILVQYLDQFKPNNLN